MTLKAKSLATPEQRTLYTQMWFCHLEYGLLLSEPLIIDDAGIKVPFRRADGTEKTISVGPLCGGHLVVNEKQRQLVLLTSVLLASCTGGDGFERGEKKTEIFGHVLQAYREQTEAAFIPAAKALTQYWATPRNSPQGQELFRLLEKTGQSNVHTSQGSEAVTQWLLSLEPSVAQIRKDKFVIALPQTYLDFHRLINGWWALPVNFTCKWHDREIAVRVLDDWRQRSRLLAIGAAWKMLFREGPLPAIKILVDANFTQVPRLAVSPDGKSQTVIPFTSLAPAGQDIMALPVRPPELQSNAVADLQNIYPSLDDPLEFVFYGLIASLATEGSGKAETEYCGQIRARKHAEPSGLLNDIELILTDDGAKPEILQCFAEPDWRWFSRWTQIGM